ncbi:MAG: tetratricopeptide repeat protein [Prolixibacteraceae bacterium]
MEKAQLSRRILAAVVLILISLQFSSGQQSVGKEALGIDYFQQGDFEKALPVFAKLAQSYPDNAMFNYYYGVCLIKNNIFETAAKEALLNSVVDKTPANANFYLGNYFHALEQWQEAKDFYDRYEKTGSKLEKKSIRLDYFVSLCEQKKNPFTPKKASGPALFGDTLLKPPPKIDEKIFPIPEALQNAWFNFQVNEELAYHSIIDFKSEASKVLFTKAWMCTGKNDSLITLTDSLRKEHDRIARVDTRLGMVQQIVDCEQKSYQLMREREKFLDQSRVKETAYWEKAGKKAALEYNAAIQERENNLNESKKKAEKLAEELLLPTVKKDTTLLEPEKTMIAPENPANNSLSEILVYKVQVGSFKNGVMSPSFKVSYPKISKLRKIDKYTDEKKYVIYTIGNFSNFTDASKMKEQLIREGMKGSVVVTFDKNTGKQVKLLPPSGSKKDPVQNVAPTPVEPQVVKPTPNSEVENLIFKVQIGSFKNDLQSTAFRKANAKISKQMKVEKYTDSKKYVIYTVGNYLIYKEAVQLKDQMVQEGIKDAFVAAFRNGERIKMNEAMKLVGGK